MADWAKFNGEEKLSQSRETIKTESIRGDEIVADSRGDLKNGEIATRKSDEEFLIERKRSSGHRTPQETTPRAIETRNVGDATLVELNFTKEAPRLRKKSDQIGILLEEQSKPLNDQSYENDAAIEKSEDEEESNCLDASYNIYDVPGSRIRQEARQELKELSLNSVRRSDTLYNEVVHSPQKHKSVFTERNSIFGSPTRILSSKNHSVSETSTEKLVNGKSPREDKQQHHVQFNKDSKKQCPRDERSLPSPSIAASATSSSEVNTSLGQLCEAAPPDGGWGWVVVAASFMVNLIADGITFSFGVIYVEFLNYFGEGKSKTAWIGSLFMAMPLLSGPVAGFLTDRYGCRRVSIAGSILATTGFVISSYANSMEVLVFTFGILAGFGLSLCFVAAVVIVAYYFDKKRSFATGLSVCGSGIGTFIFAPVTQYLLAEYGWRGTTLILAGLFLNLAVCGCLMRDLEWTTTRAKAKTEERRKNREKRRSRVQSSSVDSISANSSLNTLAIMENLRLQEEEDGEKLFSSLVSLPTFVKNGERVPLEVLELLSTRKNVYNVLLQNYPSLLISSRSFSDSGALHDQLSTPSARFVPTPSSLSELKDDENKDKVSSNDDQALQQQANAAWRLWWSKKMNLDTTLRRSNTLQHTRLLPTAYLKDIRMHRHSLTYRGAMLNIHRYRLRASSCPDIYRNSMTTIAKTKLVWYAGLWDLIVDMLDFSHFSDSRFLLFAISNFLLHTWYDVPYVYLTDNAIEMGFSETDASILISVIGITNMGGEILLGWAGDRAWVNASIVYAICMALCGAVTALIPMVVSSYYTLCAISGAFGLFIGANYSLTSIILVELITLERFTNAYGLLLLVQGVANLMGPPLAGWLYDITGTYDLSFYLAGLFIALSGVLLLAMPLISLYRRCVNGSKKEETDKDFSSVHSV
ncbi:monocarboxylate transporter 9 [Ptiloglossa arizonensis]|uniref:monocarboxylate transporter 9 n=1 Tax=Ptiloglossa arizonensis TaxID=3350558 RepID=UPI003F9EFFA5